MIAGHENPKSSQRACISSANAMCNLYSITTDQYSRLIDCAVVPIGTFARQRLAPDPDANHRPVLDIVR
jgi:hypothetical protein